MATKQTKGPREAREKEIVEKELSEAGVTLNEDVEATAKEAAAETEEQPFLQEGEQHDSAWWENREKANIANLNSIHHTQMAELNKRLTVVQGTAKQRDSELVGLREQVRVLREAAKYAEEPEEMMRWLATEKVKATESTSKAEAIYRLAVKKELMTQYGVPEEVLDAHEDWRDMEIAALKFQREDLAQRAALDATKNGAAKGDSAPAPKEAKPQHDRAGGGNVKGDQPPGNLRGTGRIAWALERDSNYGHTLK